jgi:hypothetical protein
MKISMKSWHYRLIRFVGWNPPRSLCGYFWAVVFAPLKAVVYASGFLLVALFALGPIAQFFVDGSHAWAFFGGALDIGLLTALLIHLVTERRYQERHARIMRGDLSDLERKPREPSLLLEWLRAKHQKFCPMLEFDW